MAEKEIYLFTGPELGDKNEAIENIRDAAKKKNGDLEEYRYYTADVRIVDVVSQLQSASLFSPAIFIVLKNAEAIKLKDDIDLIASWAKSSADSPNTLILVSDENTVDKKLENAVPSNHKKIFWEMFENQKPQWVTNFFRKNGFSVTPDAVSQILDMVENNTDALKSECSRFFFCFERGHTVTEDDVDKILAHNREENAFTLFEAMSDASQNPQQRFETAMEILHKIRSSKESNSIVLLAGLTYCFRQLRNWHKVNSGATPPTDTQLKQAGFSGKKNQERYRNAAKVFSSGSASSVLALIASTDMSLRENGTGLEDSVLTLFIYSAVIKNGIFPSEYTQE